MFIIKRNYVNFLNLKYLFRLFINHLELIYFENRNYGLTAYKVGTIRNPRLGQIPYSKPNQPLLCVLGHLRGLASRASSSVARRSLRLCTCWVNVLAMFTFMSLHVLMRSQYCLVVWSSILRWFPLALHRPHTRVLAFLVFSRI